MEFQLNLTQSLATTKTLLQVGVTHKLTWEKLCECFKSWYQQNQRDVKDTYGFSIGEYKKYTHNEWRVKLYELYLKYSDEINDTIAKSPENDNKINKAKFKLRKVHDENTRIKTLQELFPSDTWQVGFHRVARDLIKKQAIVLDIDNTSLDSTQYDVHIRPNFFKHIISPYTNIMYSSYSSIPGHAKFRVIIPTNRPFTIKESGLITDWVITNISTDKQRDYIYNMIDITSFEPSRFFYIPVSNPDRFRCGDHWHSYNTEGHFLNVDDVLKQRGRQYAQGKLVTLQDIKKWRKEIIANDK